MIQIDVTRKKMKVLYCACHVDIISKRVVIWTKSINTSPPEIPWEHDEEINARSNVHFPSQVPNLSLTKKDPITRVVNAIFT